MKRTLFTSIATTCCAAALFITGCYTPGEKWNQYVNLSQVACSFLGCDNEPLAVDIKTSPTQWTATPGASWVRIDRTDERTLTISVDDNDSGAERNTVITIEAGQASQQIRINQLAPDNEFARYRRLETFQMGAAMSPSGRYIGGFQSSIAPDDSWQYSPTIIDTETGEVYEFGPFPESLYYLTQTMAITDQGLLFISDGYHGGQIAINTQGDICIPDAPADYRFRPEIQATSADGKYWVGYAQDESLNNGGLTRPLLWIDGEARELPILDLNYRDEEIWVGVMARGISADGSVIYGTSWEGSDFGMLYWINDEANTAEPKWVGHDKRKVTPVIMQTGDGTEYESHIVDGCICTAELTKISPSGKWIATTFRTEEVAEGGVALNITQTPAFFNTETETTVIVDEYSDSTGMYVTDDGIAFIGIGTLGVSSSVVYDLNTRTTLGSMAEWVYDTYELIIPGSGFISYVSPDGKHILGSMPMASAGGVTFVSWYVAPPIVK